MRGRAEYRAFASPARSAGDPDAITDTHGVAAPSDSRQLARRIAFCYPFFDNTFIIYHLDREAGMGISPEDLGDRAFDLDSSVWIVEHR